MRPSPTVLLFDIDGTLVSTGGAGRRAIERAFGALFGRTDACSHFRFDGMTDRAIVRRALDGLGALATEGEIDRVIRAYLDFLSEEVHRSEPSTYIVHRGVHEALEVACGAPGVAVGLGTGNVREGAKAKLNRVGLYERFGFGGFGCDHEDRAELLRKGAERGAAVLGQPLSECRVVIVGDTPKDVAAAHAIGAECLAVATGAYDVAALRDVGARWVFPDLMAPGALDALLAR